VALGGWSFHGSFGGTATAVTPVRAMLLEQQENGLMTDATGRLFGDSTTNGAGSVLAADFNGDGRDDIVFPAHNESPFLWAASTAFISRADGAFDKITLPDAVMDHDARVVSLGGRTRILARSFGGSGNNGFGPGFNLIYTWSGSNFGVDLSLGNIGGMSVLAGKFNGDADDWLIIGDLNFGPGVPYDPTNVMLNYAYQYAGGVLTPTPVRLPTPYFNDKAEYAALSSHWDPYSKTHTSRLWLTDFNQDGLSDIVAGQELWSAEKGLQRSVFQMLVNKGRMNFADQTDVLNPEYAKDAYSIDYSVRLADVDNSGIDSMFLVGSFAFTPTLSTPHGNYLFVNDGTGRLYAVMHEQFAALAPQLIAYARTQVAAGRYVNPNSVPSFYPYRTATGTINYVVMLSTGDDAGFAGYIFVNLPLGINLTTDFRRALTITERNGSRNIRTFAGDDTIYRVINDPDCRIDGGLGNNSVVYPGPRSAWSIVASGVHITITPTNGGPTDTLTRIQNARFDDQNVDLTALL
jgi:hypothetical protein